MTAFSRLRLSCPSFDFSTSFFWPRHGRIPCTQGTFDLSICPGSKRQKQSPHHWLMLAGCWLGTTSLPPQGCDWAPLAGPKALTGFWTTQPLNQLGSHQGRMTSSKFRRPSTLQCPDPNTSCVPGVAVRISSGDPHGAGAVSDIDGELGQTELLLLPILFSRAWPPINSLDGLLEHFLNIPPKLSIHNLGPAYESSNFIV